MEKISHKGGILLFQQFSKTQIEIQTILTRSNLKDGKTEQKSDYYAIILQKHRYCDAKA